MKVENILVSHASTCTPQTSLQEVAMLMWDNDCGAIPVVDGGGHPVGIVTDRDIAMGAALQHRPLWEIRAEEITNHKQVICCHPGDGIASALKVMEKHQIRRLPVVDANGKLCGIVSMGDIVAYTALESKKGTGETIAPTQTLDYLKHISAHHRRPAMAAAV